MSKLPLPIAVLCVLASVICALWAAPKLTTAQKYAKARCDNRYNNCMSNCNQTWNPSTSHMLSCQNACIDALSKCYGKIGIEAPPRVTNASPQATASVAPTGSPTSSPKRLQPQGTLTQASPSASPKVNMHPQATLTRATPSPNMILRKRDKKE